MKEYKVAEGLLDDTEMAEMIKKGDESCYYLPYNLQGLARRHFVLGAEWMMMQKMEPSEISQKLSDGYSDLKVKFLQQRDLMRKAIDSNRRLRAEAKDMRVRFLDAMARLEKLTTYEAEKL